MLSLKTAVRRQCFKRLTLQHRLLCSLPTRASTTSSVRPTVLAKKKSPWVHFFTGTQFKANNEGLIFRHFFELRHRAAHNMHEGDQFRLDQGLDRASARTTRSKRVDTTPCRNKRGRFEATP